MASPTIIKTGDGSHTVLEPRFKTTMRSRAGAATESKHVFLELSGFRELLEPGKTLRVLEVGFGTGLNFFQAASVAERRGANLIYAAMEDRLLPADVVDGLGYGRLVRSGVYQEYLKWRQDWQEADFSLFEWGLTRLRLLHGNARQALLGREEYDIVFFDPFGPSKNPELWESIFIGKLYDALKPGGVLTACRADETILKRMKATGFNVETHKAAMAGQRQVLKAVKPA